MYHYGESNIVWFHKLEFHLAAYTQKFLNTHRGTDVKMLLPNQNKWKWIRKCANYWLFWPQCICCDCVCHKQWASFLLPILWLEFWQDMTIHGWLDVQYHVSVSHDPTWMWFETWEEFCMSWTMNLWRCVHPDRTSHSDRPQNLWGCVSTLRGPHAVIKLMRVCPLWQDLMQW